MIYKQTEDLFVLTKSEFSFNKRNKREGLKANGSSVFKRSE